MKAGVYQCQGINIGGRVVLTAGYCIKPNQTYEILSGFGTIDGDFLQAKYRTTSDFVHFFENFTDPSLERNMGLLALNRTIPLSIASAPALLDFCFAKIDPKSCFLLAWDIKTNDSKAQTLHIDFAKEMCNSNTILRRINASENKFCGRSRVCLPNTVGASLTCSGIAVGLVVMSACSQSKDSSEFIFVSLKKVESMLYYEVERMRIEMATDNDTEEEEKRIVSFAANVEVWSRYRKRALNSGSSIHSFVNVFILLLFNYLK
ncbi:unnamed protein product [Hermetia illucens]|uniref:Peptidase S1 domain-containing protein n=2 Tax=Hermetia illucens TaxID=343691 RepID=A0A7R8UVR8_HERIL|nr:unnamed protein product [Hermetia illucens]